MLKIVHLKFIWIILNDVLTIRRRQATGAVFLSPSPATGQLLPAGGIGRTEHVAPHRPWLPDAL